MVRQRKPHTAAAAAPTSGGATGPRSSTAKEQPEGGGERPQQAQQPQQQPAEAAEPAELPGSVDPLLGATSLVAAWLLLVLPLQGAYYMLSPQTGDWLAGLCSVVLLAFGVAAAAVGASSASLWHSISTAAGGSSSRLGGSSSRLGGSSSRLGGSSSRLGGSALGGGASASALSTAAALALVSKPLAQAVGALVLSPGLSMDTSQQLTGTWLALRSLVLALLSFGPPVASLGFAAGHAGCEALLPALPSAPWLLVPVLIAMAAWAAAHGVPGPLLPKPACTVPAVAAAMAALLAAALAEARSRTIGQAAAPAAGRRKDNAAGRLPPLRWVVSAAVAASAAGQAALRSWPCRHYNPPLLLAGGQYSLLYSCEAAVGSHVSVVEGLLSGQYRYRLMRIDHSIMGGEFVEPPEVAGQSVYTTFYLQQAILAVDPNATAAALAAGRQPRSLHVGLGVGTAVKGLQQAGTVADVLELHGEVAAAAATYFGARAAGATLVGDALATLGALTDESYDYIIHDVFSGGGSAPPLMREAFFRRLKRKLRPEGVAAVNYVGGRGPPLKQLWCRLRLAFDNVRCFGDREKSPVKNYVLFASDAPLDGMEAGAAAIAARQAEQAQRAQQAGQPSAGPWDVAALDVLRGLAKSEVKFTFDRQRCIAYLGLEAQGRPAAAAGQKPGGLFAGPGVNLPPGARQAAAREQQQQQQGAAAAAGPGSGKPLTAEALVQQMRRDQGSAPQGAAAEPPRRQRWAIERWKEEAQRGHAMAAYHWGVMRRQLGDELWRTY